MASAASDRTPLAAAVASGGAGLLHIAAAGATHADASLALVLVALGGAQLGWGAWAGTRPRSRSTTLVGALLAAGALLGWVLAATVGLPGIDALADPLSPAVPDVVAAILSFVVLASLGRAALAGPPAAPAPRPSAAHLVGVAAIAVLVVGAVAAVPGTAADRRDERALAAARAADEEALGGIGSDAPASSTTTSLRTGIGPFDPAAPFDLSDVVGTTAAQRAGAERLVGDVLAASYPSRDDALADGYVSIGDDFTGEEHLIDWSAVLDPATLDPARPEALVYDVGDDGERTLAAVMFVLPPGTPLDAAPTPGGSLTPWHLHGELCVDPRREPPAAVATTDATGTCADGFDEPQPAPTLHVWVVRHPCGPFSELEGVGTDPDAVSSGCEHRHG